MRFELGIAAAFAATVTWYGAAIEALFPGTPRPTVSHAARASAAIADTATVTAALGVVVVLAVSMGVFAWYRRDVERQKTLRALAEQGRELPRALLAAIFRPRPDVRRGLVLGAIGLTLALVFEVLMPGRSVWTVGLLPFSVGAGYLFAGKLEESESIAVAFRSND